MNSTQDSRTDTAVREISQALHKCAMQMVVLEIATREILKVLPPELAAQFSVNFKSKVEAAMQNLADRLMPNDDAEISAAVRRILEAASDGRADHN